MQRLTAILFLCILVFNFFGYKLVLSCLQIDAAVAIENKVDKKQYCDEDLISIKTSLNLPYYTSSPQFERAYGSVTINGKDYEYVKKRVYNDTLEVLCLPNGDKTKIKAANNDIAKASADGQASTPIKKSGTGLKITLPDFFQSLQICATGFSIIAKQKYSLSNSLFSSTDYTAQKERPPQSMRIIS